MNCGLLLSGGIDSIALCYWKRPAIAITIDYGQHAAEAEITAAAQVANALSVKHEVISIDCSTLGHGTMTRRAAVAQSITGFAPTEEWWPYRNQLLVTLACARCLALGVDCLLLGSVASDSIHMDGSREFYKAIDTLVGMQEGQLRVEAPAIEMSSLDLIRQSQVPFELLAWSHSCHRAVLACGQCRGCYKHQRIYEALLPDIFG